MPLLGLVGEHVRTLHRSRTSGWVSHVFNRCVYAQFDSKLICIGLYELGGSSITALLAQNVSRIPSGLTVGAQLQFSETRLFANQVAVIGLDGMANYQSSSLQLKHDNGRLNLPQFLLPEDIPPDGLAPLLNTKVQASAQSERLIEYTKPAVQSLLQQIRQRSASDHRCSGMQDFNVEEFKSLFGAGPGLTPSGDDFIAGIFSALHLSNHSDVADSLWHCCESTAKSCTTQLSYALIEQAAKGELSERLACVVGLQLKGSAKPQNSNANQNESLYLAKQLSIQITHQLNKVGHTSGWDWYAGFILCLRASNSTTI